MKQRKINSLLFAVCVSCTFVVMALSSDKEQTIHIEADSVEIDDIKGFSIYSGNVKYTQGTIRLLADTVKVFVHEGKLQKLEASGELANFDQTLDDNKKIHAEAMTIKYFADTEQVLFEGNARLDRGGDQFSGNYIEYLSKEDVVNARKAESGEERVQVIIQPRKEVQD